METKEKVYCKDCKWFKDKLGIGHYCVDMNRLEMKDTPTCRTPVLPPWRRHELKNQYNDCPDFQRRKSVLATIKSFLSD